jgi:hypothetical protein
MANFALSLSSFLLLFPSPDGKTWAKIRLSPPPPSPPIIVIFCNIYNLGIKNGMSFPTPRLSLLRAFALNLFSVPCLSLLRRT